MKINSPNVEERGTPCVFTLERLAALLAWGADGDYKEGGDNNRAALKEIIGEAIEQNWNAQGETLDDDDKALAKETEQLKKVLKLIDATPHVTDAR